MTTRNYLAFKKLSSILFFLALYLASGSLDLLKDGGARSQGAENFTLYQGPLNYVLYSWLIFTFLLAVLNIVTKIRSNLNQYKIDFLISILIFSAIISTLFAREPIYSLATAIKIIGLYICVVLYSMYHQDEKKYDNICKFFLIMQISSLIFALLIPSYGISVGSHEGQWQGIFTHKNGLGNFSAFAFVFAIARVNRKNFYLCGSTAALSILLCYFSGSTTSLIAIIMTVIVWFFLKSKKIRLLITNSGWLFPTLLLTISFLTVIVSVTGYSFSIGEKDTSFSERNLIWFCAFPEIINGGMLGHGLTQFERNVFNSDSSFFACAKVDASNLHNGFLDVAYSLGWVGLCTSILIYIKFLVGLNWRTCSVSVIFAIAFLICNTLEANYFRFSVGLGLLFLLIHEQKFLKENEHNLKRHKKIARTLPTPKLNNHPIYKPI